MRYTKEHLQFLEDATVQLEGLDIPDDLNPPDSEAALATAQQQLNLGKVCVIYQKVRPVLDMVSKLFFIPVKVRTAIQTFMATLDVMCPTG